MLSELVLKLVGSQFPLGAESVDLEIFEPHGASAKGLILYDEWQDASRTVLQKKWPGSYWERRANTQYLQVNTCGGASLGMGLQSQLRGLGARSTDHERQCSTDALTNI